MANFPDTGHRRGAEPDPRLLALVMAYEISVLKLLRAEGDAKLPAIQMTLDETSIGRDCSRVVGSIEVYVRPGFEFGLLQPI